MTDTGSLHGTRVAGRYRLDAIIGTGGVGTVWSAVDEVLGREVAVKDIVAPHWFRDTEQDALRDRTLREARAAARIGQHPNVVTVYDVVEQDRRLWIVMQLVHARSLSQVIDDDGPRSPAQAAEIGLQVLDALVAAHSCGILHRDVKPSNVLLHEDGRAILTDFGIAAVEGDAELTGTGVLMGAPAYIAPERSQGMPADAASDLWALGATLYTTVEGRPPYQREGAFATLAAAVNEPPDPTHRAGPLTPLLQQLLSRDPAARPSADEITVELRRVAYGHTTDPLMSTRDRLVAGGSAGGSAWAATATGGTPVGAHRSGPVAAPLGGVAFGGTTLGGAHSGAHSGAAATEALPAAGVRPVGSFGTASDPTVASDPGALAVPAVARPEARRSRTTPPRRNRLLAGVSAVVFVGAIALAAIVLNPGSGNPPPTRSGDPAGPATSAGQPAASQPGQQPAPGRPGFTGSNGTAPVVGTSAATSDAGVPAANPPAGTSVAPPPSSGPTPSTEPPVTSDPPVTTIEPTTQGAPEPSASASPATPSQRT